MMKFLKAVQAMLLGCIKPVWRFFRNVSHYGLSVFSKSRIQEVTPLTHFIFKCGDIVEDAHLQAHQQQAWLHEMLKKHAIVDRKVTLISDSRSEIDYQVSLKDGILNWTVEEFRWLQSEHTPLETIGYSDRRIQCGSSRTEDAPPDTESPLDQSVGD